MSCYYVSVLITAFDLFATFLQQQYFFGDITEYEHSKAFVEHKLQSDREGAKVVQTLFGESFAFMSFK